MECSVFQLVLIAILPFPGHHQEKCGSMIYTTSLQVFIDTDKSPPLMYQSSMADTQDGKLKTSQ